MSAFVYWEVLRDKAAQNSLAALGWSWAMLLGWLCFSGHQHWADTILSFWLIPFNVPNVISRCNTLIWTTEMISTELPWWLHAHVDSQVMQDSTYHIAPQRCLNLTFLICKSNKPDTNEGTKLKQRFLALLALKYLLGIMQFTQEVLLLSRSIALTYLII